MLSKALTLKLVDLCERMGLSAAAAHWLAAAAPDAEPDPHHLQAVAEEVAVHELVAVALGKADGAAGTTTASSSLAGGAAGRRIANARGTTTPSSRPDSGMVPGRSAAAAVAAAAGALPPHAGFLAEVLQSVDPSLLSLWRSHGCSSHSGAATAGGGHGPGSGQQAARLQAPWLQHWGATTAWLMQAEYLVGRGQGAAAERLLGLVLQHARWVGGRGQAWVTCHGVLGSRGTRQ